MTLDDRSHELQNVESTSNASLGLNIVLAVIMFIIIISGIAKWLYQVNRHFLDLVLPIVGLCVLLLPLALIIAGQFRRRHVSLQDTGITVYRLQNEKMADCQFVSWNNLHKVSQRLLFGREEAIILSTKDGRQIQFLLAHLKESMDPAEFFSSVQIYAPNALPKALAPAPGRQTTDYTKLWLTSFSRSATRNRSSDLIPGLQLQGGKYQIVGTIGQGGQGTAYIATAKRGDNSKTALLPEEVVLKEYILPMHHFKTQSILTENAIKLHKEATILERIDHPQIVKLVDHFVEDYRGYLVMEKVDGISLKDLVESEGKQPERFVIDMAAQICDILIYLHSLLPPIVHRDLTPDNLILQEDGKLKLVDFNVAQQLDSSATATVVGKHAYMPPEQFKGKPNEQSDIYALGCTLYFLLTGEEPEPISESSPRMRCPGVSEELDLLVRTLTALDLSDRYQCARQLKQSLLTFQSISSPGTEPDTGNTLPDTVSSHASSGHVIASCPKETASCE